MTEIPLDPCCRQLCVSSAVALDGRQWCTALCGLLSYDRVMGFNHKQVNGQDDFNIFNSDKLDALMTTESSISSSQT